MRNLPVVLLLTAATAALAQTQVSPEVHSDGRVTFRLRAPNAKEVVLRCEDTKGGPMQKDEGGVWSMTTEPLKPDIYAYSFLVDGLLGLNRKLVEWVQVKGVKLTWVETPGGHRFTVWRRYLADFASLLFHEKL